MALVYTKQLGLQVWETDIGAQKIDGLLLWPFEIVIAGFEVEDKLGRAQIFQESFLLAETRMKVVLGILFLTLGNADI